MVYNVIGIGKKIFGKSKFMGIFKKKLIITEFKGSYQNRYEYANDSIFDLIRYSKQIKFF